jgi:3-methylcrotonyl-CoA carboxylase alpha subunit
VRTNARFLWQILGAPAVRAGDVSTRLLETDPTLGRGVSEQEFTDAWLLAAATRLRALTGVTGSGPHQPASPWDAGTGFRVNGPASIRVPLRMDSRGSSSGSTGHVERHWLALERSGSAIVVKLGDVSHRLDVQFPAPGRVEGHIDGRPVAARYETDHDRLTLRRQCLRFEFVEDTGGEHRVSAEHEGHFRAPMPGHVLDVRVQADQVVEKGAVLLVLEAMKMEHSLAAPWRARVVEIKVQAGQRVEEGTDLIRLEPAE